jgi:hypothetical protein
VPKSRIRKPAWKFIPRRGVRGPIEFDPPVIRFIAGPSDEELAAFQKVFAACQRAAGVGQVDSDPDREKAPEVLTSRGLTDRTSFWETNDGAYGDSRT